MADVLVIYTGGTIGMVQEVSATGIGRLVPVQSREELEARAPAISALHDEVSFEIEPLRDRSGDPFEAIDSSDMQPRHWRAIAREIERNYSRYEGFVVLHGSDTMAYTASVLSFMLRELAKPVVITGSQIPIAQPINDGLWNFGAAVRIAGHRQTGLPLVPEVSVCFGDHLFRGNRTRKRSTISHQGFHSPNHPALGEITAGAGIRIHPERSLQPVDNARAPLTADTGLDTRVLDFSLFPGMDPRPLATILAMDQVQGLVLRSFGSGNAPSDAHRADRSAPGLVEVLASAIQAGKVIVNVTACPQGAVRTDVYENSGALAEIGVISGLDLTPEAALAKLMWLLADAPGDPDEIARRMQRAYRGELTRA